jgi:hypothetical protein
MRDWTSREFTEAAKSNTALREQGRHLFLEGGRIDAHSEHAIQPCGPSTCSVDRRAVLPSKVKP